MGIFNSYIKPGKGISKDEPEKKGFFLFWDIFFQKLTKVLAANALYTVLSLLWLVALYMIGIHFVLPTASETIINIISAFGVENQETLISVLVISIYIMFANIAFVFLGSGPASAAYAFIVKSFTNRQHIWMLSDGWDKLKENFRQAIAVVLIDAVVLVALPVAIRFYGIMSADNMLYAILCYIMVVFTIVYVWMHFYIYQIMVTFECTLKQLYKNALIFAIGKLPMNIFLTVLCAGVTILPYIFIGNPFAAFIISTVIGLSFTRLAVEFYAARCMAKNILLTQQEEGSEPEDEQEEVALFDDNASVKSKSSEEKK